MAGEQSRRDPVPPLEWLAAALGGLAALALLATIGWAALNQHPRELPRLAVEARRVAAGPGGHTLEFRIRNRADRTAKDVQVEGKLGAETASATIDYVPGRSRRDGALVFAADPRGGAAELRITGYQLP